MAATSGNRSRPAIGFTMLSIVCLILLPLSHAADGGVGHAGGTPTAVVATTEIVQVPLAFRHQEHYSHRIEQAVSDFKRAQLQQQARAHYGDPATAAPSNAHRQSQLQPQPPEHLRHSHNRQHVAAAWKRYIFPPLRHQRHQQQLQLQQQRLKQRQQQQKQQLRYDATTETATQGSVGTPTVAADAVAATNERNKKLPAISFNASSNALLSHRYFDRDGLFRAADSWTTRGPKLRRGSSKARSYHDVLHRDFFADEALSHGAVDRPTSGQRISLSLQANDEEADEEDGEYDDGNDNVGNGRTVKERFDAGTERAPFGRPNANVDTADDNDRFSNNNNNNNDDDDDDEDDENDDEEDDADDDDDDDDDYLYDDSEERSVGVNGYSSVQSSGRTAVKRFTNPFRDLRAPTKRDQPPFANARSQVGVAAAEAGGGDAAFANNDNDDHDNDDNDSDNEFSSEKWQRIQQEHHRKQQEHQRQMQALRARHGGGGSYQIAQPAVAVAAEAKQRSNDDDAADSLNMPYYIPGTLTRQKQDELGTLAAVQESRRTHSIKHRHEKALASEHVKQILSGASCRVPQRRIERIQRDPAKIYMPHCTVLHRCSDDTGCCRSERQTCAPKRTKSIDLYFYVKSINEKRGSVERLTFINHTECHCVDKLKQRPDEYSSASLYGGGGGEFGTGAQALRRATILNCNCPKLYEKILQEDGYCRCDCSSGNTGCDWLKRGMEHFSMIDRKCISEGRCKPPTCEHGNYIKKYGRCPRRDEQLSPLMLATNALPVRH